MNAFGNDTTQQETMAIIMKITPKEKFTRKLLFGAAEHHTQYAMCILRELFDG